MGHYDLNRMGWQQFEHLVQALAKSELGNGVRSFGSGKDGQRDATFSGKVSFSSGVEESWNGYGVIQVKYRENSRGTSDDWKWFLSNVRSELTGWISKRRLEKKTPNYLLFATNVPLSGTEETGGRDKFESLLEEASTELGLRGWRVWDYSEIRTLLDTHTSVRQRYLELLVTGDFLVQLASLLPRQTADIAEHIARNAVAELVNRQWVRTGDAGYNDTSKVRLSDVAIDLPCQWHDAPFEEQTTRHRATRTVIRIGEQVLNTSHNSRGASGVVLVGGPGQGKSTLAQVVAHSYRIAFLRDTQLGRFGSNAGEAFESLNSRLQAADIPQPERRRWPVVVELSRAAAAAAAQQSGRFSLLRFISDSIVIEGSPIDAGAMLDWMKSWPVCLVLDGLDEVPQAKMRAQLMEAISSFVTEMNAEGIDLLVVATTRPQGYTGEFDDALPCTELVLLDFTEKEALNYSETLTAARMSQDPDLAERVTERLISAVHERVTQRLMTTPLQVTIMTALAEEAVDLPTDRFELFDRYYKVVYDREIAKTESFASLKTLRQHVNHLHEQVGIKLQSRAQAAEESEAIITKNEIGRILRRRLKSSGFDDDEAATISSELLRLSTERLVMLVSRRPMRYEFEVRSLQEYMAARALTDGADESILENLECLIDSSHWRNTWLLAAGRLIKTREHLSSHLMNMLTEPTQAPEDVKLAGTRATLATDLYMDNLGSEFPTLRRTLLTVALSQLQETAVHMPRPLSDLLEHALAQSEPEQRITLQTLHALSRESASSLASQYLSEHSSGMTALAKQARTTLTEGRKYIRPSDRSARDRALILANILSDSNVHSTEATPFAATLSQTRWGSASEGEDGAFEVLVLLEDPRTRALLSRAVARSRQRNPDVASFGISLLREYYTRLLRGESFGS